MVEWLKHWTDDQHGLGSKPTCAILLCLWERHFTALSPAWWSWQAVLNYSNISTKLLVESNILASLEAGGVIAYPMYSAFVAFLRVRRINIEIKIKKAIITNGRFQVSLLTKIAHCDFFETAISLACPEAGHNNS